MKLTIQSHFSNNHIYFKHCSTTKLSTAFNESTKQQDFSLKQDDQVHRRKQLHAGKKSYGTIPELN